jgi:hypothetical protein
MATKRLHLSIADSHDQKLFLRQVQKEHGESGVTLIPHIQKGGRPSLKGQIYAICSEIWPTYHTKADPG